MAAFETKDRAMPTPPTEAEARHRLHEYFLQTLDALPPEFSLSLHNPAAPLAKFHPGITSRYDDDDDGPQYFDISYWILGTTPTTSDVYYDLVVKTWKNLQWGVGANRESRPRATFARTPDGYGLAIQQSINGHLSLSGSTPAFPPATTPVEPLPAVVKRR